MQTIATIREQVERDLEKLRAELEAVRAYMIRSSPQRLEDRAVGRQRHPAMTAVPRLR
jgi:hypothetical protein